MDNIWFVLDDTKDCTLTGNIHHVFTNREDEWLIEVSYKELVMTQKGKKKFMGYFIDKSMDTYSEKEVTEWVKQSRISARVVYKDKITGL